MPNGESLFEQIDRQYDKLSKGQKKLADFVREHYDKAAFMTACELGKAAGVSESTAVRFAMQLGYAGFPQFNRELSELVKKRLSSMQRAEVAYGRIPEEKILDTVLNSDIEKIRLTLEQTDRAVFREAVDTIIKARRIYVCGIRSCAPLASFLAFYLNQIFDDVRVVTSTNSSEIFEQLIRIGEEDVMIGISFPRYSMRTLKAIEFANNRCAKVIAITDSIHSPMGLYSSCNLIAKSDMASIVDSLTAPMSIINALIVALCMKKQEEVVNTLKMTEKVWKEYGIYGSDEINELDDEPEMQMKDPDQEI